MPDHGILGENPRQVSCIGIFVQLVCSEHLPMTGAGQTVDTLRDEALTYLDGLYGYAMSLSRNQAEAEDLVQDTYLKAVRSLDQFAPGTNLRSWLYTIMRNVWLNKLRHAHSGPLFVEMDDERKDPAGRAGSCDDPHELYVAKVERDSVRAAIQKLPIPYREVILLREFEGLSYQEIASILNCPAGTVMSRLGRARDKLRGLLCSGGEKLSLEAGG